MSIYVVSTTIITYDISTKNTIHASCSDLGTLYKYLICWTTRSRIESSALQTTISKPVRTSSIYTIIHLECVSTCRYIICIGIFYTAYSRTWSCCTARLTIISKIWDTITHLSTCNRRSSIIWAR